MVNAVLKRKNGDGPMSSSNVQPSGGRTDGADICPFCGQAVSDCQSEVRVFDVKNLDCANCAAEMEEHIARLPRVEKVDLTYTTKQLRVTCPHPDQMRLRFQEVCQGFDEDVLVLPREGGMGSTDASAPVGSSPTCAMPVCTCGDKEAQCDEDKEESAHANRDVICIVVSTALFVIGEVLENAFAGLPSFVVPIVFLVAYLVAGGDVLLHAARNIRHGKVFDENFLMSIATFGAIGVQQFPEAVGVMLFYRIGELFEDRAVARSRSQIMEAVDMRPETVNRLVDYRVIEQSVAADGIVVVEDADARTAQLVAACDAGIGDFLLIKPGERIPLDGTVMEGASRLDTSPVTGEPLPVSVQAGSSILSGCLNTSGMLVMRVDKPLSESMVTRILESVENASANKPQIQRFITRFAKIYTPVVIAIAVATALIPSLITGNWAQWVYTACTFLVISCPCAIVLSVPLSFFAGIGAASKLGILFKGGNAIEALKNVKTVVMDKTGTITKGDFNVRHIEPASGFTVDDVLRMAASAEQVSTHPIAYSILSYASKRSVQLDRPEHVDETAGRGIVASFRKQRGLEHVVYIGNRSLLETAGIDVPDEVGIDGYGTCVLVAAKGVYAGCLIISDEPKPESAQAIAMIKAQGVRTVMLTGDSDDAAQAIAAQVDVDDVHARLLPEQKLEALYAIRETRGPAMFVGDGINDAPVLAGADVGAAMGSGSDAAIEAADVVFMTSSLQAVPQSMRIAKVVGAIAMQNIVFALVVKIAVMVLGFAGLASMWAAVFADVGVCMICILNSVRILYKRF